MHHTGVKSGESVAEGVLTIGRVLLTLTVRSSASQVLNKTGRMAHTCNPSSSEIKEDAEVPNHPLLHSEFNASLGYMTHFLKK